MKHILDQRVILLYILAGASGDRTRRGPLCQRVGQVTPPKTGKAWMAWIHLCSIVHLGLRVGDPWEINGKSMGNQWEINGKSMGNHFGSLQNDQENYEEP